MQIKTRVHNFVIVAVFVSLVVVGAVCVFSSNRSEVNAADYVELSLDSNTKYTSAKFNNKNIGNSDALKNLADPTILKEGNNYYVYGDPGGNISVVQSSELTLSDVTSRETLITKDTIKAQTGWERSIQLWAPEIVKYNNKFYLFYTVHYNTGVTPTSCQDPNAQNAMKNEIWVSVANSPAGPFTGHKKVNSSLPSAIDPFVFVDSDGEVYLYSKKEVYCDTGIFVEKLNKNDITKIDSTFAATEIFHGVGWASDASSDSEAAKYWAQGLYEAPYVLKHSGKYYLMYSTHVTNGSGFDKYTIGYAVSTRPTSGFTHVTNGGNAGTSSLATTAPLVHGPFCTTTGDGTSLYATGHNTVFKVSNDEWYIMYHSNVLNGNCTNDTTINNGTFQYRKINIDQMGFTSDGKLFVNGPSVTNQAQPTSSNTKLTKVSTSNYVVKSGGSEKTVLKDNMNYHVKDSSRNIGGGLQPHVAIDNMSVTTNNIEITLSTANTKVKTLWLYGDYGASSGVSAELVINNKYIIKNISLGTNGDAQIVIPDIEGQVINKLSLQFSKNVPISEVQLYSVPTNNYTYKVSFTGNSGTGVPSSVSCTTLASSCTVAIPDTTPTRSGFIFKGWADTENATTASYQPKDKVSVNSSEKILYAVWEAITYTYKVSFDKNTTDDVENMPNELNYGPTTDTTVDFVLPTNTVVPAREGFVFKGWGEAVDSTVALTSVTFDSANPTITLYAIWEEPDIIDNNTSDENDEKPSKATKDNTAKDKTKELTVPNTGADEYGDRNNAETTWTILGLITIITIVVFAVRRKNKSIDFQKK